MCAARGPTSGGRDDPDLGPLSADDALLRAFRGLRAGIEVERWTRLADAALRPRLLRYFRAHALPGNDAEELVQETLVRVFAGVSGLREEEKLLPWLFVIARNVRRTHLARDRRREAVMADGADEDSAAAVEDPRPQPERAAIAREDWRAARSAIARLPAQQRSCFLLRTEQGLSYAAIAAILCLSEHTVRNHLAAARKALRRALGVWPDLEDLG